MFVVVIYEDIWYYEKWMYIVDKFFLEIFDFLLVFGNLVFFVDLNIVIILEYIVIKYFKGVDFLGRILEIDGDD